MEDELREIRVDQYENENRIEYLEDQVEELKEHLRSLWRIVNYLTEEGAGCRSEPAERLVQD